MVLGYALYWARKGQAAVIENKGAFLWKKFPKFVLGFLFISLVATIGTLDPKLYPQFAGIIRYGFTGPEIKALGNLSRWAFLLTFAGVGLRTSFKDLVKQGFRPFLVGAIGEIAIAAITLGLVLGADRMYHL